MKRSPGETEILETGIPKLDALLEGGIPKGRSIIYYAYPGVEGSVFGVQTLYHHLQNGGKAALLTTDSTPIAMFEHYREYGWNLFTYIGDKLYIADAYSPTVGSVDSLGDPIENPSDLESYTQKLLNLMWENDECLILIDSLSTILDQCGEYETLSALRQWLKHASSHGKRHTIVCNFTAWPYSESVLNDLKENIFNATIMIGGIAERVMFGQYFGILKTDWAVQRQRSVLFKVAKPGGVRVYVPKVLVVGAYNAGKSTFIRAISSEAVSVDRMGTTVAMDRGHVEHKGMSIDLFGTPGQERFEPLLQMLGKEAMGAILVVDSTKPKDIARSKHFLERIMQYGLPFVVAANKQDAPNALSPDELRERLLLPRNTNIIPTVATGGFGVFDTLERLVDMIMEEGVLGNGGI
ncbi:MAG: ATPase domain-containing protein [Methermicoccaceae archaeon]